MRRLLLPLPPMLVCMLGAVLAAPDSDPVARGRRLFGDNQDLEYPACADCHSLRPQKEEQKKAKHLGPGATLYGAAVREGWRNKTTYKDVGEASQTCAKKWQRRKKGLTAAQRADLVALLRTVAPQGSLPKRKVQRRPKMLSDLAGYEGGDAKRGRQLTQRYCRGCHNQSDESLSIPLDPKRKKKALIARTVRGYTTRRKFKPKTMSYYTTDRLSDADLRHIIAYLGR